MALFLLLSGYGCSESLKNNPDGIHAFWRKRMISVWIPFVVVEILYFWVWNPFSATDFIRDMLCLRGYPYLPNGWYLGFLFEMYIIFYICNRIQVLKKYEIPIFIIIGAIVFITNKNLWAEQSFSFLAGILLSKYKDKLEYFCDWKCMIALMLTAMVALVCKRFVPDGAFVEKCMNLLMKLPAALACVVIVYRLMAFYQFPVLSAIGTISFEIYLLHGIIAEFVPPNMAGLLIFLVLRCVLSYAFWFVYARFKKYMSAILLRNI